MLFVGSPFAARWALRNPGELLSLLEGVEAAREVEAFRAALRRHLEGVTDEEELGMRLRRFRNREMVRIALRDQLGLADLEGVLGELSDLAEVCIEEALEHLEGWYRARFGTPRNGAGEAQRLVVLGMGKLGARELNFSSDIDLVLAWPEPGRTDGPRPLDNSEFFARLGRGLVKVLDERTAEGFVFRTDLRLRPYGSAGPVAMHFDAMETYYQSQGREWERYAMIKARVVAGDRRAGERLMALLEPFVYRRYLDYGAFESLREMKAMIAREVRRKSEEHNIKTGPGGIREIEFIGQVFQLVRGGREPRLRVRPIQQVLRELERLDLLPSRVVEGLLEAYRFLRRLENRLQEVEDRQTHLLPEDEEERARIAFTMGYGGWGGLEPEIARHRRLVQEQFELVFAAPQAEGGGDMGARGAEAVWRGVVEREEALVWLEAAGFTDPEAALALLERFRASSAVRRMGSRGRERLDTLMPLLLEALRGGEGAVVTLERILRLLEAVARRSVYLSLLVENPMALSQLVRLCAASPWIAGELTAHPLLLDELLDPRTLYNPMEGEALRAELARQMEAIEADDLERLMDQLRLFRHAQVLRVAAADVAGVLSLTSVSDHLTAIAETVLEAALAIAWRHLVERHGEPWCGEGAGRRRAGFAILALGKLGGRELNYGSDLDLVFLHDSRGSAQQTDGERPVDNAVFFARLGQRLIHILTTRTAAGQLYEVDMRLRPSGNSGLLVSSIEAYEHYQKESAWTWEHQALVRARPVAGDSRLGDEARRVRAEVLARERDLPTLRREVREMRERMRRSLDRSTAERFDLKQGEGGLADIEFLVQYAVLAWSHRHRELLGHTDNIHLLQILARLGRLTDEEAQGLLDALRTYRARIHRCTLQELPALVEAEPFAPERERVRRLWCAWLER